MMMSPPIPPPWGLHRCFASHKWMKNHRNYHIRLPLHSFITLSSIIQSSSKTATNLHPEAVTLNFKEPTWIHPSFYLSTTLTLTACLANSSPLQPQQSITLQFSFLPISGMATFIHMDIQLRRQTERNLQSIECRREVRDFWGTEAGWRFGWSWGLGRWLDL
jgi:hypothetical protein